MNLQVRSLTQKLISRRSSVLCILILFLYAGCVPVHESDETDATITTFTEETLPRLAPTVSQAPTFAATQTLLPQPTVTPLPETLTVTPALDPTLVPTLTIEQEEILLQELMATNGNCELPCWWSIQLGNNLTHVTETFARWGVHRWGVTQVGDRYIYLTLGYYRDEVSYSTSVFLQLYVVDETVQYIKVSSENQLPQLGGREEFLRDWKPFFLSGILQSFGPPSSAYLYTGPSVDPGQGIYTLVLFYPELGIKVEYAFWGIVDEVGGGTVCFTTDDFPGLELSFYNPLFANNWPAAQLDGWNPEYEPYRVEHRMNIDLNTFHDIYKNPANLDCVPLYK